MSPFRRWCILQVAAAAASLLLAAHTATAQMSCTVDADCTEPPPQCKRFECQSNTCVEITDSESELDLCDDGDKCTLGERCQAGVCVPPLDAGMDSDNDGDCDVDEEACGCDPNSVYELCPLPNRLVGKPGSAQGEVLLEWNTPTTRRPQISSDPSCATVGECTAGLCTMGKIHDVCATNADCDQPPNTCRLIANWGDTADLTLDYARMHVLDVPGFTPVAPGCSRKVDVLLDPSLGTRVRLRIRARGTVNGRARRDREVFRYDP